MMTIAILILSTLGLWISFYFTGVYYRWFSPHVGWVPQICQLEEKSCLSVLQTPRAKIFGIPNSVFGLFVYSWLILDCFFFPEWIGLALLTAATLRSIYLAYSLIFVTKINCIFCFVSHVNNIMLWAIYIRLVFFSS